MNTSVRNSAHSPLADNELLARFLDASNLFSKEKKAVKPKAFEPPRGLELSVTRHSCLTLKEIWMRGLAVAAEKKRKLYGRADISVCEAVKAAREVGGQIEVISDPIPGNPEHSLIVGWPQPSEKALQNMIKIELASKATLALFNPDELDDSSVTASAKKRSEHTVAADTANSQSPIRNTTCPDAKSPSGKSLLKTAMVVLIVLLLIGVLLTAFL